MSEQLRTEQPELWWSATPRADVADWTPIQAFAGDGPCVSCGRVTTLRQDPLANQPVCRACWEALMFGDTDD